MADGTAQNGTAIVAGDEITTDNGTTVTARQAQRVKIDSKGVDGAFTDVSSTNPFPTMNPDPSINGSITALDAVVAAPTSNGQSVSGASTAGSLVALDTVGGLSAWTIQISGTWTGTMYFEASLDTTNGTDGNWFNLLGRQTAVGVDTNLSGNTTVNGLYRGNIGGLRWIRVRSKGAAHTGTATISIRSGGVGTVFLNAGLPPGYDVIGEIGSELKATARVRAQSFRIVGRAGTTGQKLFTIWNPAASGRVIYLNSIAVDLVQTAAIAVGVIPALVRVYRTTAAPTGGTVLAKVLKDTAGTSLAGIVATGDSSADGTNSGTALAITPAAGSLLTQEFAARLVTAAGYEPFDREVFLEGAGIVLRAGEGIVVALDYTATGQNPATNMWVVGADWYEATS